MKYYRIKRGRKGTKRERERKRGENKGQKLGRIRGCWAELTIIIKSTVTAHDFHSGPSFHPTMTFLHRASRANRIKTSHDITRSAKTMLSNNFLITTIYDIYIYIHPKGFYSWMEFHPSLVFFA